MVPALTPNSRARSFSLGMAVPGFHCPPAMRSASASRNCKYSGRFENLPEDMIRSPNSLAYIGFAVSDEV